MKPGDRVIRASLFILFIFGCCSLTQIGNRLLWEPVLAIVTGSVSGQSMDYAPDSGSKNGVEPKQTKPGQPNADVSYDTLTEDADLKSFVEQILNHQSQEGNAILRDEIALRLQEIRDQLALFEKRRQQEIENSLKTKSETLNQELTRRLDEKMTSNRMTLDKFELDLEESQKVNLVNLRLGLVAISANRGNDDLNEEEQEFKDRIEQIHQEIDRRTEDKKEQLQKEYREFETVARLDTSNELAGYKRELEDAYQNEYSTLKNGLEQEFKTWREKQEKNLNQAIKLRKNNL